MTRLEAPALATQPRTIALLLPSLAAGGVARSVLHLAGAFRNAGHAVDLVLCKAEGPYIESVPDAVNVVALRRESPLVARARLLRLDPRGAAELARPALLAWRPAPVQPYLCDLARYLDRVRPDVLLSAKTPTNLLALWARRWSKAHTRVVVAEHTQLSQSIARNHKWRWRYIAPLVGRTYAEADAIVCVSDGVADDLARTARLPRSRLTTIYNPVVTPALAARAAEPPPHPWLEARADPPVVVAAGRLAPQKNFALLQRAFARLRAQRPARLLILGEGRERSRLEAAAHELGIAADVALPGHVANPYAAYSRASLFVLSSDWEGLPTVLIEALACGCPVVSTDCPSGPAEILEHGRYGTLVPAGDAVALAQAMARTLDQPPAADMLRRRSEAFTLERSAQRYLELLDGLLPATTTES
ncbi:MAG: glycosyltransferase [Betaproteobacteria bacterium]|nr:glycosyltransferase [Betaproteobacteria bacterium]